MKPNRSFLQMLDVLKVGAAALRDAGIPYALGGSLAAWARGGPHPHNDLDLMVKPADATAALDALSAAGMRAERPPEEWLYKAWSGPVMLDLIFAPAGLMITDAVLERADPIAVGGMTIPVIGLDDVLTSKLFALGEHALDYGSLIGIARALREQIDWPRLRALTEGSPYARAFFTLAEGLGVAPLPAGAAPRSAPRVRVVGGVSGLGASPRTEPAVAIGAAYPPASAITRPRTGSVPRPGVEALSPAGTRRDRRRAIASRSPRER